MAVAKMIEMKIFLKVINIILLLTKVTTKGVMVSILIAVPMAYWAIQKWLQNFAYRVDISVPVFILACAAVFLIALLTILSQAFRAANANPVDALRYE